MFDVLARSPRAREGHFKAVEALREQYVEAWTRRVEEALNQQMSAVIQDIAENENLTEADLERLVAIADSYTDEITAVYYALYEDIGMDFARRSSRSLSAASAVKAEGDEASWLRMVREYVAQIGATRVTQVNETTKEMIRQVITQALDESMGAYEASELLKERWLGLSTTRAERIARTEIIAASNHGTLVGVSNVISPLNKVWISVIDNRTRGMEPRDKFNHVVMNGVSVPRDEPFDVQGESMMFPGDSSMGASAANTIQCFPGDTLVTPVGAVLTAYRSLYEGEVAVIKVAGGNEITVTPNHPVLTRRGWVAAGALNEGDKLLKAAALDGLRTLANGTTLNIDNVPARIEEVFNAAANSGVTMRVNRLAVDFYGDVPDSDVDIVHVNNGAGHSHRLSDYLDALPFDDMAFDDVISVKRNLFHGFVYTLETETGIYEAQGIVAKNCRCTIAFEVVRG